MSIISSTPPNAELYRDEPQKLNIGDLNIGDLGNNFESLALPRGKNPVPGGGEYEFKADSQQLAPRALMQDLDSMSDLEVQNVVDQFVALSKGDLVPGLYASAATGVTPEGWSAVTEFASEEVTAVSKIVTDYVEMGPESLDFADVQTIAKASVQLGNIEKLQARLGLEDTPQGQIISIASGAINVMSQAIAGAIANPDPTSWSDPGPIGGLGHLTDLAGTFETLGETLKSPTTTFLDTGVGTITNIEVFNDNELNMPDGIVDRGDLEGLSGSERRTFDILMDPEEPMATELHVDPDSTDPVAYTPFPEKIEDEEEPVVEEGETPFFESIEEGETPFFESSTGVPEDEAPVDALGDEPSELEQRAEELVVNAPEPLSTTTHPIPENPIPANAYTPDDDENIAEDPLVELTEDLLPQDEYVEIAEDLLPQDENVEIGESPEPVGDGEQYVEMGGGAGLLVKEETDAPAPWYEQSVSRNLLPLDGVGTAVSEMYNAVIENASQIVGEAGFLETGVMTGFTAYLEELGEAISEITAGDAADISDVVAPLLLDLDQGQFMLEQMGLTDSPLYGATQVMTEVVGSVYYAGQVAQNDPERGAALLTSIQPQVQLLGEVFGSIVDTYAEIGELNFDITTFFGEARELASDIYESIYQLNDVAAADTGDNE